MAPMAMATTYTPKFLKRSAPPSKARAPAPTFVQLEEPVSKKIKRNHVKYHKAKYDLQQAQRRDASIQDEQRVQDMLTRSISLALEAVGFEAADAEAVESLRLDAEEYMAHYLTDVCQSMLSSRRAQAIPQDFLQALHTHQLSLRSLVPHLEPPVPARKSQYPLQYEDALEDANFDHPQLRLLGPLLNNGAEESAKKYIPKTFPTLPSKHTYRETAEFPDREQDPRRVRERATEEGRLGEGALRKLVSNVAAQSAKEKRGQKKEMNVIEKTAQMWRETMEAMTGDDTRVPDTAMGLPSAAKGKQKDGESLKLAWRSNIGSAVNADKRYWRKPAK